jgi:hypothetical protein
VYAVAWGPDGRHLAAAGVDKSIRVWEATAEGGKLVHSVFAHEGPVTRLAYAADGKTLYSLSEDRSLKAWDAGRMVERKLYPTQPETLLAFAVRPDHKQLALGRYDGVLALLDEATGKVQSEPLPVKPKPPQVTKVSPAAAQRGKSVRVTLEGKYLDQATDVIVGQPGVVAKLLADGRTPNSVQADLTFPPTTPAGVYQVSLKGPAGQSGSVPFTVDAFGVIQEKEPNDSPTTGQKISLPATVVGVIERPGDLDFYRFDAKAGQQVGVQAVTTAAGSKLEPVLELTDRAGQVVAESTNGVLGHTFTKAGTYALGVRDREYRGGKEFHYRLQVGDIPVVTAVFPMGLQRGTEAQVSLEGVHLGGARSVRVRAPADAAPGSRLPVPVSTPLGTPLGGATVVVGELPEVTDRHAMSPVLPVPGTANGRIDRPGVTEEWRFPAKKGQRLIVEVNARRLGSPLDSFVEVLDAKGQPVPRAVLRCLAKTYTTFRDHDSSGPGIRMEAWNEFAMNDYVLVGTELIRIRALPRNPDDDCQFFSRSNQRVGYLGTTPTHHSLGTPMYKVSVHPPGTAFPPNGLPLVTVSYHNDDGGPGYGKDSRLVFDPPADGEYRVRVGDSRGQGGSAYAYRLTARPPRPSFNVSFNPTAPAVWRGGAIPVTINIDRVDEFDGPVDVRLEGLPRGFSAPATNVRPDDDSTAVALYAEPTAKTPDKAPPLKVVARAKIDGQEVVREATGGVPKAVEPGDVVTTTDQSAITVRPGGVTRLTAKVERRNGFKGRVPLEVRGLPHGVRVLDVGLNGILITESESARSFEIYCEPWVEPTEHPFVVLADAKNAAHAARSVLLKVVK